MFRAIRRWFRKGVQRRENTDKLSLQQCFEIANDETYTRSHGFLQNRAYAFYRVGDRLARVERLLDQLAGIDGYAYVGSGDNAVIVQYSAEQVIRFRAPEIAEQVNTQVVPIAPMVCPVWKEVYFENARLNFVPFIPSLTMQLATRKISRPTAEKYVYALLHGCFSNDPELWFYDYKNFDFKFEQVGLLPAGAPIVLDLGAVIYSSDVSEESREQYQRDKALSAEFNQVINEWNGKWVNDFGRPYIDVLDKPPDAILKLPDVLA
jgi:hypothetical protein